MGQAVIAPNTTGRTRANPEVQFGRFGLWALQRGSADIASS